MFTLDLRRTRPSCFPEETDPAVLRRHERRSRFRHADAPHGRSVPHAEALAVHFRPVPRPGQVPPDLVGVHRRRGIEDDLGAKAIDPKSDVRISAPSIAVRPATTSAAPTRSRPATPIPLYVAFLVEGQDPERPGQRLPRAHVAARRRAGGRAGAGRRADRQPRRVHRSAVGAPAAATRRGRQQPGRHEPGDRR